MESIIGGLLGAVVGGCFTLIGAGWTQTWQVRKQKQLELYLEALPEFKQSVRFAQGNLSQWEAQRLVENTFDRVQRLALISGTKYARPVETMSVAVGRFRLKLAKANFPLRKVTEPSPWDKDWDDAITELYYSVDRPIIELQSVLAESFKQWDADFEPL